MKIRTKTLLSFLLVFVLLISSISVSFSVFATGPNVSLELNGGAIEGTSTGFTQGDILPNYEKVTKSGATFGGWYTSADFTGTQVFSVPTDATGSMTYYARWINHTTECESFDSYASTDGMSSNWAGFKWPATEAQTTLNTDSVHAHSGNNSMKITPNAANTNETVRNQNINFSIVGSGVAFWVEATSAANIRLRFNTVDTRVTQVMSIPAGKSIITVPWSQISGDFSTITSFWAIDVTASVADASASVYVDSIGTFTDNVSYPLTLNTNGGEWAEGYTAPVEYGVAGLVLPNYEKVTKAGAIFGGWYTDADFTGAQVFSIPEGTTGSQTYYARWINHTTVGGDDFDSYTDTTGMSAVWENWTWPLENSDIVLSTDSTHAYSANNSMKLYFNVANKNAVVYNGSTSLTHAGNNGVALWVEATGAATIKFQFNNTSNRQTEAINIPVGKSIITVPWAQISGDISTAGGNFWAMQITVAVNNIGDSVYVDNVGVFNDHVTSSLTLNTNGGKWVDGYTAPVEYSNIGFILPNYEKITKSGATFGGWYTTADFTGAQVFSIPAGTTGSQTYYARWINHNVNFDDYESYSDNVDYAVWTNSAVLSLNTNAQNVYNGTKSLKFEVASKETYNQTYATVCKIKSLTKKGDGVAFWINSEKATDVLIAFDDQESTYTVNVPAGKSLVTIPWADFTNLPDVDTFGVMFIRIPTKTNVTNTVYFDDIGTYADEHEHVFENGTCTKCGEFEFDYNDDEIFDIRDLVRLKKYLADDSVSIKKDLDDDGVIETADLAKIRARLLG